ncbi:MAG: hypothetical protein JXR03_03480 [Cyclobacteriaceae bacterium]
MIEAIDFKWIKDNYFSKPEKTIRLKKGEILIDYHKHNSKLFLVLEGKFFGFLEDKKFEDYPIFEASKNKFIGVYSYFSRENLSYSRVVAEEDAVVAYYDKALLDHDSKELERLMPFLMSVVVNELYARQHFARKMAEEKQQDVNKLMKAEKMATLGQMAAGLAHELNNSIGVINSNLTSLIGFITENLKKNKDKTIDFFLNGLDNGNGISTLEARNRKSQLEKKFKKLDQVQVKRLSKTNIDTDELIDYLEEDFSKIEEVLEQWKLGRMLHDTMVAARHSGHVVKSVKQLGVSQHLWSKHVDVNESIREALIITQNLTKRVKTNINLQELPPIQACLGGLTQVWINLIKNAIESMIHGKSESPQLQITSQTIDGFIQVEVSDNGPGIPEEILFKIFEPSFTTKVDGLSFGLGLGLSIVQKIITEHDSTIEVESQFRKTVFVIKIPLTH